MSQFCIAAILGVESERSRALCRRSIEAIAKELGVGVQFDLDDIYRQPALDGYWNSDEFMIFNISDHEQTWNCEKLLCADWCNLHEAAQRPPLSVRLNYIASLLTEALRYGQSVHLFLGTSGDELADLSTMHCDITELCHRLLEGYEQKGDTPPVRVVLT